MILSTYTSEEIIHYLISSDVSAIQNVKGIGGKTAQRIIIDLKLTKLVKEKKSLIFYLFKTIQSKKKRYLRAAAWDFLPEN